MKKPKQDNPLSRSVSLTGNYIKLSLRSYSRNKLSAGINFFGLGVGLFASLLIAQYAKFESSYDQFHQDYDRIYRASFQRTVNNEIAFNGATTFLPVGTEMLAEYPEVDNQCRFYYPFTHAVINYGTEAFAEEKPVFADASYFEIFSYRLMAGDPATALVQPNTVILSETLAHKFFGDENPMGKLVKFSFEDGDTELKVTGVLENPREDSHLRLHMIISMSTLDQWPIFRESAWALPFYHTYIKLNKGTDPLGFEEKSAAILEKHRPQGQEEGAKEIFRLQPLQNIHLDSDLTFELAQNGNRQAVNFLMLVATMILLIAYLNYINLATAVSSKGAKEVGIRKVMGSFKRQILQRYLIESFLMNMISLLVAVLAVVVTASYFSSLMGVHIEISSDPIFWLSVFGIVSFGAIFSSLYPALVLSNYQPITVLRGKFSSGSRGSVLRKVLVSSQFIISVSLIGGTILLYQQTSYLLTKDLGFAGDKVLVINAPRVNVENEKYLTSVRSFGNELKSTASVNTFTHSGSVPGKVMSSGSAMRVGNDNPEVVSLHVNTIDYGYFETYELDFAAGRGFSQDLQSDDSALVINEAAMEALGFESADQVLQGKIGIRGGEFEVIGVASNYHHTSLKTSYEPIIFVLAPARTVYISLNVNTGRLQQTLQEIESQMKVHFPENPFDYFFLDQAFDQDFKAEMRYAELFKGFSILAIALAAMGLFGLSSFLISQRTKEIGVRKVMGAKSLDLFKLLSSSFTRPVISGSVLACAALYFGGRQWLQNFPFRIDINLLVFIVPLAIVIAMMSITMAIQTLNALRIQPAKTLRNE